MKVSKLWIVCAAILLSLAGCSKADDGIASVPPQPTESVEQTSEVEEAKTGNAVVGTTVKAAPYECPTVNMAYPGGSTTNMAASGNASTVGLSTSIFAVDAGKGTSNNLPGLNTGGTINLYASPSNGNGAYFDVSALSGYWIRSISINFKTKDHSIIKVFKAGTPEMVEVAGVADSYEIDSSVFRVKNCQNDGGGTKTIEINSITITYEGAAKDVAKGLDTQLSLSYTYEKEGNGTIDTLDKAATGNPSSYTDWTNTEFSSSVDYAGNSSGNYNTIQLRQNSNSGIVSTANPESHDVKKITIKWNSNTGDGRIVEIYGKNTAYESTADLHGDNKGDLIGTLTKPNMEVTDETELSVVGSYKFIGIKAKDGAAYLPSINIQWGVLPTYEYSDVAIRFGNLMKKTLWDRLHSESVIQGYGVFLSTSTYLAGDEIKDKYDVAKTDHTIDEAIATITAGNNIKNFYTSLASKEHPDLADEQQKGDLTGDYYIWNLYKGVATEDLKKEYAAVAYIRVESEIVFLNEVATSAKGLAADCIATPEYDEESFEGSLNNLANLA